jgi:hypothetical protein
MPAFSQFLADLLGHPWTILACFIMLRVYCLMLRAELEHENAFNKLNIQFRLGACEPAHKIDKAIASPTVVPGLLLGEDNHLPQILETLMPLALGSTTPLRRFFWA